MNGSNTAINDARSALRIGREISVLRLKGYRIMVGLYSSKMPPFTEMNQTIMEKKSYENDNAIESVEPVTENETIALPKRRTGKSL